MLVGVALGGFWSLSAAAAVRLVPGPQVPKALAIFNAGNALAMVLAAPLGSYLGSVIGWRGAFLCVAPIAALALLWQLLSLPSGGDLLPRHVDGRRRLSGDVREQHLKGAVLPQDSADRHSAESRAFGDNLVRVGGGH